MLGSAVAQSRPVAAVWRLAKPFWHWPDLWAGPSAGSRSWAQEPICTTATVSLLSEAVQEHVRVEGEVRSLRTAQREIEGLVASTRTYTEGALASLGWLCDRAPHDYRQFEPGQKERLAALVNHVRSLGELIRKEVAL